MADRDMSEQQGLVVPPSDRLSFELFDPEHNQNHKQDMYDLDQDPEVMRYITGGKTSSMQMIEEVLMPRMAKYRNPEKGWGIWKVTDTVSGEYYGWILVRPWAFFSDNPEHHNLELGWRFKRSSWGKGIATEAARAVADALSRQDEVTTLCAIAEEENQASTRIMEKLGMKFIRKDIVKDPLFEEELVIYGISV